MTVGDVTSNERGTGARFNDGKPPLELIPVLTFAEIYAGLLPAEIRHALVKLADWQAKPERTNLWLIEALLILREHIDDAARVLDHGRKKYAEWNWAKGMPWSVCVGCILRHAKAIAEGEEIDPESGLSHAAHITCNLIFLLHYMHAYPEGDDRPPAEFLNPERGE